MKFGRIERLLMTMMMRMTMKSLVLADSRLRLLSEALLLTQLDVLVVAAAVDYEVVLEYVCYYLKTRWRSMMKGIEVVADVLWIGVPVLYLFCV
jgi:hypothetical protein